jgi:uncharacterized membrane protein YgdD (TMEM256/DUF423 family)
MTVTARWILVVAGILLALAVVLGAVGTHALRGRLTPDQLAVFETAVRYHAYNALGLLGVGIIAGSLDSVLLRWAAGLILGGIVLFSGSLYLVTLGAPRAIHVLPPFGGFAWIVGWLVFAAAVWRG